MNKTPTVWAGRSLARGLPFAACVLATTLAAAQPDRPGGSVPPPPAQPASPTQYLELTPNASQTREQLRNLLRQHPSTVAEVLRLDPSLATHPDYLAAYPALAAFIKARPEIARNPRYFFGAPGFVDDSTMDTSVRKVGIIRDMFVASLLFSGFVTFVALVGWTMRSAIEYRRWLRLTRVHTDVHSKLVDRFTAADELLAYVQSPAGRRFLESGPAPAEAAPGLAAPFGRILGALQAGAVVTLVGLGLLYVSRHLGRNAELLEVAPFAFMSGIVAVAVGVGFLVSAGMAFLVSRRLGLLEPRPSPVRS